MLKTSLDQVVLINEQDEVLGIADKLQAHQDKALHRAISVFLFDKQGYLLMQQRSLEKIVASGCWANTVCGNVRPSESNQACAVRRLQEELGLIFPPEQLFSLGKFRYQVEFANGLAENELDELFVLRVGDRQQLKLKPNPAEVMGCKWFKLRKAQKLLKQAKQKTAPWFDLILQGEFGQKLEEYGQQT